MSPRRRRRSVSHGARTNSPEADRKREEVLRPCAVLGYDHASIALHLIERGAHRIAESELRRAIWLNPFEPAFREHLARCLYLQDRLAEAREEIAKVLDEDAERPSARQLLALIDGTAKP